MSLEIRCAHCGELFEPTAEQRALKRTRPTLSFLCADCSEAQELARDMFTLA